MIKIGKKRVLTQKNLQGKCPSCYMIAMKEYLSVKIIFEQGRCKREDGRDVRRKINSGASIMLVPFYCKRCGEIIFFHGSNYGLEDECLVVACEVAIQVMVARMEAVAKKFRNIKDKRKLVKRCLQPIFLVANFDSTTKGRDFQLGEGDQSS